MKNIKTYKLNIIKFIILGVFFVFYNGLAQNPKPVFEEFKPVYTPHYTNSNFIQNNQTQVSPHAPMGATAQDIINQSGGKQNPIYIAGMTPVQIQQANLKYIQQQMANDPAYQIPNVQNGFQNPAMQKERKLIDVMNEINEIDNTYIASTDNKQVLEEYQKAFSTINDMLIGKTKLSFINAVYATETAFGNPYLNYSEYKGVINKSADFIKQWLHQENAPFTSDNLHYAVQQFMGGNMSVKLLQDDKKTTKIITHSPFKYDYEDYDGKKDYRNYFATKCLATGTGQCSSMPDVYLLLCDALGINGYKTFVPYHSYIKYKSSKGSIENYEPTSNWTLPDKWYQDNLGVSNKAKMNGIYLDTLNKKQCVANTLVDLAISYMVNNVNPDTAFVQKCLATSNKYFPKGNNLYGYLAKSSLLQRQLHNALKKHGVKDLSEVNNYSDTKSLYKRLMKNEQYLSSMGYEEMPQELYEEMLKHQTNKTNTPDAKTKKSLFIIN